MTTKVTPLQESRLFKNIEKLRDMLRDVVIPHLVKEMENQVNRAQMLVENHKTYEEMKKQRDS